MNLWKKAAEAARKHLDTFGAKQGDARELRSQEAVFKAIYDAKNADAAPQWIEFRKYTVPGRTTPKWEVWSKEQAYLGVVTFYPQWRKFVYDPSKQTIYEEDCLRDIATFIEARTAEWREEVKARKS